MTLRADKQCAAAPRVDFSKKRQREAADFFAPFRFSFPPIYGKMDGAPGPPGRILKQKEKRRCAALPHPLRGLGRLRVP